MEVHGGREREKIKQVSGFFFIRRKFILTIQSITGINITRGVVNYIYISIRRGLKTWLKKERLDV